jgi:hypothetical protein
VVPSARVNLMDKPLSKGKAEVSLSAFAYLFSELVQYSQTRVNQLQDLENRCVSDCSLFFSLYLARKMSDCLIISNLSFCNVFCATYIEGERGYFYLYSALGICPL